MGRVEGAAEQTDPLGSMADWGTGHPASTARQLRAHVACTTGRKVVMQRAYVSAPFTVPR